MNKLSTQIALLLSALCLSVMASAPALAATSPKLETRPVFNQRHLGTKLKSASQIASSNWSGYAVSGGSNSYNTVTSSWVQPSVTCSAVAKNSYSAYWVGIDGLT